MAGGEVDDAGMELARLVLRAVEAGPAIAEATAGKHGVAADNQVSPDVAGEGDVGRAFREQEPLQGAFIGDQEALATERRAVQGEQQGRDGGVNGVFAGAAVMGREGGADGRQPGFRQPSERRAVLMEIPGRVEHEAIGAELDGAHQREELADIGDDAGAPAIAGAPRRGGVDVTTQVVIGGSAGRAVKQMPPAAVKVNEDRAVPGERLGQDFGPFGGGKELRLALLARIGRGLHEGLVAGRIDVGLFHRERDWFAGASEISVVGASVGARDVTPDALTIELFAEFSGVGLRFFLGMGDVLEFIPVHHVPMRAERRMPGGSHEGLDALGGALGDDAHAVFHEASVSSPAAANHSHWWASRLMASSNAA